MKSDFKIFNLQKKVFVESASEQTVSQMQAFAQKPDGYGKLSRLFDCFSRWCTKSKKPIVLMIDEVDSAADHQVFLDFLSQLRGCYIDRDEVPAFRSVILAGVYDIRHMKQKFRPEEEHRYNSPWNNVCLDEGWYTGSCQNAAW